MYENIDNNVSRYREDSNSIPEKDFKNASQVPNITS